MSKELTLTDKLRLLRFGKVDKQYLENQYYDEIENALENIDEYVKEAEKEHEELMYAQKKVKALQIIREKGVDVYVFKHSGDLQTYNDMVDSEDRKITQEEFDLLKEVLYEDNK